MPEDRDPPLTAQHASVVGRVQGVGFRWSACEAARRIGVSGWIRNAADGSVEVHIEGAAPAVSAFVAWLRRGPPGARVDEVRIRTVAPTGVYRRFSVEP